MKITKLTLHLVSIPMLMSVKHALAERTVATNVVLLAENADGNVGVGECCPRDYVTGETIETVQEVLSNILIPEALDKSFTNFHELVDWLTELGKTVKKDQLAAFCALELSLLDLGGKVFNLSAGQVIDNINHQQVNYSAVLATANLDEVEQICQLMKQFNIKAIKVKLVASLETNISLLELVRKRLGDVELRGDANSAWTSEEAIRQCKALKKFNLKGMEQPVAGNDYVAMQAVTGAGIIPVVADESLCSMDDAHKLINEKGCDIFNLRISKCGGLIKTHQLYLLAQKVGLQCQLGAQVGETSVLSAAGIHLATRCEDLLWFEGCYGKFLLADDITTTSLTIGDAGIVNALDSIGLGVILDEQKLQKYSTKQHIFTA